MNDVIGQVKQNKEKIDELRDKELVNIHNELEFFRNRPFNLSNISNTENRGVINFQNYKRNPMEFLERFDENLMKHCETRWTAIRGMLDEHLRT